MVKDLSGNNPFSIADSPSSEEFAGIGGFAITPSDNPANNFDKPTRAIYVGSDAGNVAVEFVDGSVVTFTAVPVGTFLPVQAIRVNATNTTSTGLVGIK